MFCPRCGQQQATDQLRFCSRCGFPMEGAMALLAHGGMLPQYQPAPGEQTISPRRKGVKQGALIFLAGVFLVPLFGVLYGFSPARLEAFFQFGAAFASIVCFLGGLLRMLYAGLFEEGAPKPRFVAPYSYPGPAAVPPPARVAALPPPVAKSTSGWRTQTAEIAQPPSVTDGTTRLLERTDSESE